MSYENLTREELLVALARKDADLAAKDQKLAEQDKELADRSKKLAEQDKELADRSKKLAEQDKELAEQKAQYEALSKEHAQLAQLRGIMIEGLPTLRSMVLLAKKISSGDPFSEQTWEQIRKELIQLVRDAKLAPLLNYFINKGTESIKKKQWEVENKQTEELGKALSAIDTEINRIGGQIDGCRKGLNRVDAESLDETKKQAIESMRAIDRTEIPAQENKKPATLKGRQVVKRNPDAPLHKAPKFHKSACEHPASDYGFLGTRLFELRTVLEQAQSIIDENTEMDFYVCHKCKKVIALVKEDAPLPIGPERTLSADMVFTAMRAVYIGTPLERFRKKNLKVKQLGNNTLYDQMQFAFNQPLKPLMQALKEEISVSDTLLVDETTYDCLQMQGKGTPSKEAAEKAKEQISSQTYTLAVTTPHYADHRVAYFATLETRSAASIKKALPELRNLKNLIADGYGAYPTLRRQLNGQGFNVVQQTCLTHFRRPAIKVIGAKSWQKTIRDLDDTKREQFLAELTAKADPMAMVYFIIYALRKVFQIERDLKRSKEEPLADYFKRVRYERQTKSKVLMQEVESLINCLAPSCVTEKTAGKWVRSANEPYTDLVLYFKNRRDELMAFLDNPQLVCNTNDVERQIRPITILRKNSNFAQSRQGLDNVCNILTIFETARLNGITDPFKWLRALHCAVFAHCAAKHLQGHIARTGNLDNLSLKNWNWEDLLKDFDCTPFLPWNWVKDHPQDETDKEASISTETGNETGKETEPKDTTK